MPWSPTAAKRSSGSPIPQGPGNRREAAHSEARTRGPAGTTERVRRATPIAYDGRAWPEPGGPVRLAAIHAGDWLMHLLIISIIVGISR